ncbi:MAG: NUDIX domain-containing protein [Clostridia bacterium]|nr:NUDIX domain-containing protein [Clostridia bacterium]
MKFTYCPVCGTKLRIIPDVGDEGPVPYCDKCQKLRFDVVASAVLVGVVLSGTNEILLIKQDYVHKDEMVLIAGHVKIGDNGEETAKREVLEEVGLEVHDLTYVKSYFHSKSDLLMLGYFAYADSKDFKLSREVDGAKWVKLSEVKHFMKEGSLALDLASEIEKVLERDKR